ncbi:5-formyltetrahydrofolate cyclo-ligase [Siculibacillus lacustris]|uniref:5-formyltetrahydrofolate cyclo-ligase n=1 Tax=Siculibacillus lacustris TaxID=1549641 RepID=A0A4Q9VNT5_9HYPH|nr:5-formyltetrahydrofolate cyclo-ligase [Siculibacillus lacustris]TBW37363.1 5-formyltetrahydrofolate cyclo-ligase [Siculibacillus lacustris]
MTTDPIERWRGRNESKDDLRRGVWAALEAAGASEGSPWSRIPDYLGKETAAEQLATLPEWKAARIVKANPDPAQIPVRRKALEAGKLLYAPVPELVKPFPFVELDPEDLARRGIAFADAARSEVFVEVGRPIAFEEMKPMDFIVVGCVAVTRSGGRTGKGGGFADLELGIFRELGLVPATARIATTVHDLQIVHDSRLTMLGHDQPLDFVATPSELIVTETAYPTPTGVAWEAVQPDQYAGIPFLTALRRDIERRAARAAVTGLKS